MKKAIITLFLIGASWLSFAQTNECLTDFEYLIKKIKTDYPGYNEKVTDATRPQLLELEKTLRQKISKYPDSCGYYFNQYTLFFKDSHLGVGRARQTDEEAKPETMDVSSYGKNINVNVDSLQKATKNNTGLTGVWEGFFHKFAIVPQDKGYAGVAISGRNIKPGIVLFDIPSTDDSIFNVTYHSLIKNGKTDAGKGSLHVNGKVLELHNNTRYVRKSGNEELDRATLFSYKTLYPNGINTFPLAFYLDDSTYYLRIPDFYSNTANEFVQQHWDEIMSRPNLIIDIRNNGGGQDNYYSELAKIIYTKPYESKGVEWYASEGNIKLFEDAIKEGQIRGGEEGIKRTQGLVNAMKTNVGGYVDHPSYPNGGTVTRDSVYPMPKNVGIIINEENASSAEQFLLTAKHSDKVILFGNKNTAGVLDYSNVTPTDLPSKKYSLYCPMTRSKRLPENPIDNIGIAPDVTIPFPATKQLYDRLDEWVYFVKAYLEIINTKEE